MKRKIIVFYLALGLIFCVNVGNVTALSKNQERKIATNCEAIRDSLKNVQILDSRTRVFLGSHYETVLSKYITPLNVRMVENNLSDIKLLENQNVFADAKVKFSTDFINYQKALEELIAMDCRTEPEKFYDKLVSVRAKREKVVLDVKKMRELVENNIELVKIFKETL